MSMQPPAAPHRVAIADIQIPFWRLVVIMVKWALAAIPATIILIIIFALVSTAIGLALLRRYAPEAVPSPLPVGV